MLLNPWPCSLLLTPRAFWGLSVDTNINVCQHGYHLYHYFLFLAQFLAQNYCLNHHHFVRLLLTISVHKQLSDHFFEIENKDSPFMGCGYRDVRAGNPRLRYEKSSWTWLSATCLHRNPRAVSFAIVAWGQCCVPAWGGGGGVQN